MVSRSVAIVTSHPIQYYSPIFRELSLRASIHVFFAHRPTPGQQGSAGYGVPFEWDIDLTSGFEHSFLENVSAQPSTDAFRGCDTPMIARRLEEGFDGLLVTGWNLKTYWQAILSARRLKMPVMVRGDSQLQGTRGVVKTAIKNLVYPKMLSVFDGFLYPGQRNKSYLQYYGIPESRLFFSPHCVDTEYFSRSSGPEVRRRTRYELGVGEHDVVLAFVGRLLPFKKPGDLIEAAALLQRSGKRVTVLIAGSGPMAKDLDQLARVREVPLISLGFCNQSRMPSVYAASDVLVLPSDARETWGLVCNEAIACGRPIVVSDACGSSEDLVASGRGGRSYSSGDVGSLASAISAVLTDGPSAEDLDQLSNLYSPATAADGIMTAAEALVERRRRLFA